MPSFDTIAEWVLDNLYLAGGVTGAVLLGLLLVLLVILRGRRAPSKPTIEDMFGRAHQPTEEMDLQTPLAGNAEARSDEWLDEVDDAYTLQEGEPSAVPVAPAPSPPPAAAVPFRATPGAGDEHVHSVISGLLQGRGDLTAAELRRIELLRPEKVLVALTEIEGTLSGRGKEAQRARLVKLQQYAELLSPGSGAEAPPPEAKATVEHDEYIGVADATYDASSLWSGAADAADSLLGGIGAETVVEGEPAPDLPARGPIEDARAPWDEEPTTTPDEEHEAPAQAPAISPGWSREGSADWLPGAIPAPSNVPTDAGWTPSTDPEPEPWNPMAPPGGTTPEPVIGEALWTEPEAGNETFHDEREDAEEEAWIDAPADLEEAVPVTHSVEPEDATQTAVTPAEPVTVPSLEALDLHLETAEDVLSLEVSEREDALTFLQPLELGRLFAATQDTHLKFSIIDILGREQDTDSIEALQACLDDPDPEVQLYALEAAERILGAG